MASLGAAMAGDVSSQAQGIVGKVDKPKMSDMEVSRIEIEPSDNGGFTAQCFYDHKSKREMPGSYVKPTKHVYTDGAEMMADLAKKLGISEKDEEAAGGEDGEGGDSGESSDT